MRRLLLSTSFVIALSSVSPAAFAQAQVYLTQAQIPGRLSEQQLRNFMRGHHARQINEEADRRTWKFQVGTFFRGAPGDLEAHLLFYDVEHGSRLFVTEMAVFLSSREETAFLQHVRLDRPTFKPRNRYIVVLTVRRTEMASVNFELVGQQEERSGRVEFSDSETRDPDELSIAQQNAAAEAQRIAVAREQARQQEFEQAQREQREQDQREANFNASGGNEGGGGAGTGETAGGEEGGEPDDGVVLAGTNTPQSGGCASCTIAPRGPAPLALATALALAGIVLARRRRKR